MAGEFISINIFLIGTIPDGVRSDFPSDRRGWGKSPEINVMSLEW